MSQNFKLKTAKRQHKKGRNVLIQDGGDNDDEDKDKEYDDTYIQWKLWRKWNRRQKKFWAAERDENYRGDMEFKRSVGIGDRQFHELLSFLCTLGGRRLERSVPTTIP
jgi:hypothetical protein